MGSAASLEKWWSIETIARHRASPNQIRKITHSVFATIRNSIHVQQQNHQICQTIAVELLVCSYHLVRSRYRHPWIFQPDKTVDPSGPNPWRLPWWFCVLWTMRFPSHISHHCIDRRFASLPNYWMIGSSEWSDLTVPIQCEIQGRSWPIRPNTSRVEGSKIWCEGGSLASGL